MALSTNVTDSRQVAEALREVRQRFGVILTA